MIYVHSIGRAARYYPNLAALSVRGKRLTFLELHQRIERIAVALHRLGFRLETGWPFTFRTNPNILN